MHFESRLAPPAPNLPSPALKLEQKADRCYSALAFYAAYDYQFYFLAFTRTLFLLTSTTAPRTWNPLCSASNMQEGSRSSTWPWSLLNLGVGSEAGGAN